MPGQDPYALIVVLVPVLGRPSRAAPLVESLDAATTVRYRVVFLCSPHDDEQIEACEETREQVEVVPFELSGGDYARKINHGAAITEEPWIFQGADDVVFHSGWDEAVLAEARDEIGVVGTNDLGNPLVRNGRHATHSLIRREYVELLGTIDEIGAVLHEGYHHCWVDNELVETAMYRRVWAAATRSLVEHRHPIWRERGGGRKGTDDDTYRRGQTHYREDYQLFNARRPLWGKRSRPGR